MKFAAQPPSAKDKEWRETYALFLNTAFSALMTRPDMRQKITDEEEATGPVGEAGLIARAAFNDWIEIQKHFTYTNPRNYP
jgi:hypothetical protein